MPNAPRFLITTADMRSWRDNTPILFLGGWCYWSIKNEALDNLEAEVVPPYGWNEGQRARDYAYVHSLRESLLHELSVALNCHHGTNHSSRYWRIMLGSWLHRFTAIMFNRWATIQFAIDRYEISGTVVLDFPKEQLIPFDYYGFARLYRIDEWNHAIYSRILMEWTEVPYEVNAVDMNDKADSQKFTLAPSRTFGQQMKRFVASRVEMFSRALGRSTDAFFISTCLPFMQECRLHLALGQIPVPRLSPATPEVSPDLRVRNKFKLNTDGFTGFEQFIRKVISEQLPVCYLEGYGALLETVKNLPWPSKPKLIFTSNRFDSDEVFKAWAASKIEIGVPYIIGQHGSNYGTAQYAPSELHEVATADRYLTWGWADDGLKHYPTVALPILGKSSECGNPDGGLLLVERVGGHREVPWDDVSVFKDYLEDQFKFVENLPERINKRVTVRLYAAHLCVSWSEDLMWKERSPDTRLDLGVTPIDKLMRQNRLIVYAYNSTGILESLALNVPAMFFWNTFHEPLRATAQPYFDQLKKVGVFHETPESAAIKVNEIWDDVVGWWNKNEVQEARRIFCNRFARMTESPILELKEALLTAKSV